MALQQPVLIIGAGIVGLTLANGLQQAGIPFEVYERDHNVSSRGQGWAITIHWALPYLQKMLPPEIYQAVEETQVDPEVGRNDNGNFLFLNLETLDSKFRIPPNTRRRVNREKMRQALLRGVQEHVHWSKRLVDIAESETSVTATFEDGSTATGSVLVGAEGSNSRTRKYLCPTSYQNYHLPVRFVGVSIDLTYEEVVPLRNLDPLLFQGSHPETGSFLWVSMLDVPETNGTAGTPKEHYRVQINVSWMVHGPSDEVAASNPKRLAQRKTKSAVFHPKLNTVVDSIPDGTEVLEIKLADWPTRTWSSNNVTLVGDAGHAMTMYRGEAANHGILDAYNLLSRLRSAHAEQKLPLRTALDEYETEMKERASTAVLLSREACLDAHDFNGLNENSAVLKRRAISAA